jgi:hypothetical protein
MAERDRVVYLRMPRPVAPGEASARLAADL